MFAISMTHRAAKPKLDSGRQRFRGITYANAMPMGSRAKRCSVLFMLPKRGSIVCKAAAAQAGKLISKVEIPAFIPRTDLMDQLLRWAVIEIQEDGVANVGSPCKVTPVNKDGNLWGFNLSFLRDGTPAADLWVGFDDEVTSKSEWVGRGSDGFPVLEGEVEEIRGKHFEIRKVCERSVNESLRQSIRDFCQLLVAAINKYYAFGTCFADDRE